MRWVVRGGKSTSISFRIVKVRNLVAAPVEILFINYEELDSQTDYSYTLFVKYGDQLNTHGMIAGNSSGVTNRRASSIVDGYLLSVSVRDQVRNPLNASVTVGGQTKSLGPQGTILFTLPKGTYTIRAEYLDVAKTSEVVLDKDSSADVIIPLYSFVVQVMDDNMRPLDASVDLGKHSAKTDAEGIARFFNLTEQKPEAVVKYGNRYKRQLVDVEKQHKLVVVFDLNKPELKELHTYISKNGIGVLSLYVEDPGSSPSGVASVSVSYEAGGIENKASAYTIGYNTYEAKIPAQRPGTLVKYNVRVEDKEGNVQLAGGSYMVPVESKANETGPQNGGFDPSKIGVEAIVIGLIVFGIFAYGVFYYLKNVRGKGGEDGAAPPQAPPGA